jgi:hypothetical protein
LHCLPLSQITQIQELQKAENKLYFCSLKIKIFLLVCTKL